MKTASRPALLLAVVVLAAVVLGATLPPAATAADDRPRSVTRALDYIYARQLASGGFAASGGVDSPGITPWAVLAIVAGKERPTAWDKGGKDPLDYLQSLNLETTARSSLNAPAFYAKVVMAYAAAGRAELIYNAGTPRIDLLDKLLAYRNDDGHFSPATSGDRSLWDVSTTTWALIALRAAAQSDGNVSSARAWLVAAQHADGGWGLQTADAGSTVDQTAAVVQALVAAGADPEDAVIQRALGFLDAAQRSDAGFGYSLSDVRSNAESTAWAVQAIIAAGEKPTDARWVKDGRQPLDYLRSLQRANGSFAHRKGDTGQSALMSTTQSLIALAGRAFPYTPGSKAYTPRHMPSFTSFQPRNGAVLSTTNDARVVVEYKDTTGGTGIAADAVRVFVDGANRTGKAKVTATKLTLSLVDLSYGQHTIEVRIRDQAGNRKTRTHTITVSYAPSSGGGGSSGGSGSGSTPPAYVPPSDAGRKPTPSTTLYPTTPTPSASGVPAPGATEPGAVTGTPLTPGPSGSPLPEPSATVTGQVTGDEGAGGGSAGLLGGTLLAMLPLGAALSYWLHRRHVAALAGAGQGKLLAGGGTPWQRLKSRLPGAP